MDGYLNLVNQWIKMHMQITGDTAYTLAKVIGCEVSTFHAKVCGYRRFTVEELNLLARHGVRLPPLDADARRVRTGKVGKK
ncbi:hypothetical protein [Trueperella pyogenes]